MALAPGAGGLDISDLLKKLANSGLIPAGGKAGATQAKKEEDIKNIKEVNWKSQADLKV